MAGTAKQQAVVGGQAVVVQRHALVTHRHILRQQCACAFFAQRLGGDDVAAGRQHLAAQLAVEAVEVGVAAQHQGLGAYPALGGMHLHFGAIVDAGNLGLFEQLHTQAAGHGRFPQGQVERVQVARAHVDQPAHIAVGADHAVDIVLADQPQLMCIAQAAQFFGVFGKAQQLGGFVGQVAVAPGQVAGDGMLLDPLADDLHGLQAHQLHAAHAFLAYYRQELFQAVADAADQLPAIAPTGAPAQFARFQQDDREAAFGQLDGSVQARVAAADDTYIGAVLALQEGVVRVWRAAGGVVGGGVLRAVDHWFVPGGWWASGGG
ncbi:hypothetical protein D3C76_910290 [compost metagenome]